jgi:hypothetical protein
MNLVWANSDMINDKSETLVLLALADWSNDEGVSFPSMRTLARKSRMSERNAQYIVKRLVEKKLLAVNTEAGPKGTNIFEIKLKVLREGVQPLHRGVQPLHRGGCKIKQEGGAKLLHPIHQIEPSEEEREAPAQIPDPLPGNSTLTDSPVYTAHFSSPPPRVIDPDRPNSADQVVQYGQMAMVSEAVCRAFFDYYEAYDWHGGGDKPIRNWKAALKSFANKEHQFNKKATPAPGVTRQKIQDQLRFT